MALASYASRDDFAVQVTSLQNPADYATQIDGLLSTASRSIDGFCDRYFYNDGPSTKYFDGDDSQLLLVPDFFGAATVRVAGFENADPAGSDWTTLTGDGVTPPSDFFFEPAPGQQLPYVGKSGDDHARPWYRIRLPQTPPQSSQTFKSQFPRGLRTVAVTPPAGGGWGWPAVPDEIALICLKISIRLWEAAEASYTGDVGDPQLGPRINLQNVLDIGDLYTLENYKRPSVG